MSFRNAEKILLKNSRTKNSENFTWEEKRSVINASFYNGNALEL